MFCSQCGTENADTGRFCIGCGRALSSEQPEPAPGTGAKMDVRQGAAAAIKALAVKAADAALSRKIWLIAAVLLLVAAVGVFGVKTMFARSFAQLFASDENYAREYIVSQINAGVNTNRFEHGCNSKN